MPSLPWRLIAVLATLFGVLQFLYHALDRVARAQRFDWVHIFAEEMTGAWSLVPMLPVLAWLVARYPLLDGGWKSRWPVYVAVIAPFGFCTTTINYLMRLALFWLLGKGVYDYGHMPVRYLMELSLQTILFAILVGTFTYSSHRRRVQALERELIQAQMEALRLQIQPHFLFNALNVLSQIVYEDPRAAERMIARLSDFLRRVLDTRQVNEVALSDELELLELYVEVMRARFESNLACEIETDARLASTPVPQLILQPVVENAIRHGADPETGRVAITVTAGRENGHLLLTVANRSSNSDSAGGFGLGLTNIRNRLLNLYGDRGSLAIDHQGDRTEVAIRIPIRTTEPWLSSAH
jgi:two-component system LytT family sensor kinase